MVLSEYSGFLHQLNWSPWYNWNIVESGVKHHIPYTREYVDYNYKAMFTVNLQIKMKEFVILSTLYLLAAGFIEEQPMSSLLYECFSNNRYNVTDNRADTIHYKCIQNYLSQTYDER
jgi:hypothetical protein